ncbi:hypothetical protein NDI56_17995 [Haloarcula sp. S1CR25-12]|uniref:Uncharacterized protein n=1 Tax=Haloarcula saliterrae TaxID=2950534 RepID=A0ABU2FHJ4_9EURY|nr:hypothetical protein [Haloarcula sp. S1CR25-12]MDS0261295.1 hypothetical protein [Haloarcula sp. S1CR25-12]
MNASLRTDSAVERGQWLVRELLQEPVREAVREALEAESASVAREETEDDHGEERRQTDDGGRSKLWLFVGLLAAVAVAYALQRRWGEEAGSDSVRRPSDVDEQTAAGDRVEEEAPVRGEN